MAETTFRPASALHGPNGDNSRTLTHAAPEFGKTGSANADSLATKVGSNLAMSETWNQVIDLRLIEWGAHPDELDDDELIPPTTSAISRAIKIAQFCRDQGVPAPMLVLPDRDGGVIFEYRRGDRTDSLEIDRTGRAEHVILVSGNVSSRHIILPQS